MTQNICVSVQMDEKSFHDFASFDLLRHNKAGSVRRCSPPFCWCVPASA